MEQTQCLATCLCFRAPASSFFLFFLFSDFSHLWFVHLSILSKVWLQKFLRLKDLLSVYVRIPRDAKGMFKVNYDIHGIWNVDSSSIKWHEKHIYEYTTELKRHIFMCCVNMYLYIATYYLYIYIHIKGALADIYRVYSRYTKGIAEAFSWLICFLLFCFGSSRVFVFCWFVTNGR